jgi:alkaline phosphatase D
MLSRRNLLKGGMGLPVSWFSFGRSTLAQVSDSVMGNDDCGVASGDPRPDSVIIWTRIPRAARLGLGEGAFLPVRYQVATDPSFANSSVIRSGEVETSSHRDYTVKVCVRDLDAYTTYYYRFLVGSDWVSEIGRTKTAPAPGSKPENIRFAFVSCQKFTDGYYSAYRHLASEDVDFCIHLGDHIYEQERGRHGQGDPLGGALATTLDDYRAKWRHYLSDPSWREVRRLYPWIHLWDDHEIYNDYAGTRDRYQDAVRVAGAYQAFDEYIPHRGELTLSPEGVPSMQIYRSFIFGDLIELFVTDQRQYRTPQPCNGQYAAHQCPASWNPDHTMLGPVQKAWFKESLTSSRAIWKFHASAVMVSPMRLFSYVKGLAEQKTKTIVSTFLGGQVVEDRGIYLTLDQWDGYPGERQELLQFLHSAKVENYVVITGDIHSAFHSELQVDPVRNQGPVVGVEIVTTSVSSESNGRALGPLAPLGQWLVRRSNPNLRWADISNNGYTVMDVSREGVKARHMAVKTVWSPDSPAVIAKEARLSSGRAGFIPD